MYCIMMYFTKDARDVSYLGIQVRKPAGIEQDLRTLRSTDSPACRIDKIITSADARMLSLAV